jgi:serine/threonine protein kinase
MGLCSTKSNGTLFGPHTIANHTLNLSISTTARNPKETYNILKILGKGTYSIVYLVQHKKNGVKRAMKQIKKSLFNEKSIKSIYNEIIILSELV